MKPKGYRRKPACCCNPFAESRNSFRSSRPPALPIEDRKGARSLQPAEIPFCHCAHGNKSAQGTLQIDRREKKRLPMKVIDRPSGSQGESTRREFSGLQLDLFAGGPQGDGAACGKVFGKQETNLLQPKHLYFRIVNDLYAFRNRLSVIPRFPFWKSGVGPIPGFCIDGNRLLPFKLFFSPLRQSRWLRHGRQYYFLYL